MYTLKKLTDLIHSEGSEEIEQMFQIDDKENNKISNKGMK